MKIEPDGSVFLLCVYITIVSTVKHKHYLYFCVSLKYIFFHYKAAQLKKPVFFLIY